MSRIKDYIMEVESLVTDAYMSGASTEQDIFVYVNDRMPVAPDTIATIIKELFLFVEDYHNGR